MRVWVDALSLDVEGEDHILTITVKGDQYSSTEPIGKRKNIDVHSVPMEMREALQLWLDV